MMDGFTLQPIPPFRLDLTIWALRRVPINEMDRWDGQTYRRVLIVENDPIEVSVVQTRLLETPELFVTLSGLGAVKSAEVDIAHILSKMLGLNIDLTNLYRLAGSDSHLGDLSERFVGFRPPRFGNIFEALVNGIACQQLSLVVGIHLLNRLCTGYGLSVDNHHAFPRPEDLAAACVEDLRKFGFSRRKVEYILSISRAVVEGQLDLNDLEKLDNDSAVSRLCEIHGVCRWTAQYVALRGLGRLDVYPADDVGSQSKIQRWLRLSNRPDYEGIHRIIGKWSPYRGLVYFLLLLDDQMRQGLLLDGAQTHHDYAASG